MRKKTDGTRGNAIAAMSVGQIFGTPAFAIYIFCIVREFRKDRAPTATK